MEAEIAWWYHPITLATGCSAKHFTKTISTIQGDAVFQSNNFIKANSNEDIHMQYALSGGW